MSDIIARFQSGAKNIGDSIIEESPTILTVLGATGVISTAVLAVKGTPKAQSLLKDAMYDGKGNYIELSTVDIIKIAWKPYIPALTVGALTIGCIFGANSIHLKRNAALVAVYSITAEALKDYQRKVVDILGEKRDTEIIDAIAEDKLKEKPLQQEIIFHDEESLFFDGLSGRYFSSTMEKVRRAVNDFNYELMSDMFKPLNEFYDKLGLENTDMGRRAGWDIEHGQLNVRYSAKIAQNDEPCIVLTYTVEPKYL